MKYTKKIGNSEFEITTGDDRENGFGTKSEGDGRVHIDINLWAYRIFGFLVMVFLASWSLKIFTQYQNYEYSDWAINLMFSYLCLRISYKIITGKA